MKSCPGPQAGQARSCVALTGNCGKANGAHGVPAEVSRHQQPTPPSQGSSITAAMMCKYVSGTASAAHRACGGCKLGHGLLALPLQRLCDHPWVLLNQGRAPKDNLHTLAQAGPAQTPSPVGEPWGLLPALRPAMELQCSSLTPEMCPTGAAALNLPFFQSIAVDFPLPL